jgi:PadR family transcriptional regulator, regulatory protein PadR
VTALAGLIVRQRVIDGCAVIRPEPTKTIFKWLDKSLNDGLRDFSRTRSTRIDRPHFFSTIEVMADRSYLGEFELMLLLVVIHLGDEAYGVPISHELEKYRGREVSVGSVYAALERLESKGLVVSSLGDPTPERGGKAKRYFRITKQGLRQVRETRRILNRLWCILPAIKSS